MADELFAINRRFKNLITRSTLITCQILFGGSLILTWLFTDYLYEDNSLLIVAGFGFYAIYTIARHYNFLKINKHPLVFISIYHLILMTFLIFLIPVVSPFAYIWLLLIFISDYYYENTGLVISFLVLVATTELNILVNDVVIDKQQVFVIVSQLAVILGIGYLLAKTHQASSHEQKALKESSDIARFEHQRLISLINNLGNAIVSTDEQGKIKLYNAAALDLLNTNVTLEGEYLKDFLHLVDEDEKPVDLIKLAADDHKQILRNDLSHVDQDGEKINLYINLSPIYLSFNQKGTGYIFIMRDITKEKTLEQEKDEFVSVVSHELRTPMTIAEGNISNAMLVNTRTHKDKDIAEALELAHKQVLYLSDMINDLSTLSRAERNVLELNLGEIDPTALAEAVKKEYEPQAKEKGLELKVKIESGLPKIYNSQLYIQEIIQNFITNSIKYTKEGSVLLSVTSSDDDSVKFSVSDTGIGISKSDQKKIFDKFFRSEDFRTRESSGTGLGLYVTAKLIKKIGAKVEVNSTLNKGSEFSITIKSITEAVEEKPKRAKLT